MKKKSPKKVEPTPKKRDFLKEYQDFLRLWGGDIDSIKFEWTEEKGHIKKFSLLEATPTSILSNHTFSTTP